MAVGKQRAQSIRRPIVAGRCRFCSQSVENVEIERRPVLRVLPFVETTGMNSHLLLSGLLVSLFIAACGPASRAADYDAKSSFKKDAPINFPDFTLTYVGDRHVASDKYPRGFNCRDFRVAAGATTQTVSWSAGTGDIGPAVFRVGAKEFWLELVRSDKLGPLKPDELVVSPARR